MDDEEIRERLKYLRRRAEGVYFRADGEAKVLTEVVIALIALMEAANE